jgi:predicted unusual protein kinase regulating ubiquinone biosynthesis (AarF/ABC1/UbiB family)
MENVAHIRADDVAALREVGIVPAEVAARLFDCYVDQLLLRHFVHADPHAGNLFVKPLLHPDELPPEGTPREPAPGERLAYHPDRPFQLAFVDFGMAVEIPRRLRAALRHYVLGIMTRDARLIMDAYLEAGVLLPGADLTQLEELTIVLLERFPGTFLAQAKDVDPQVFASLLADYRTLIYSAPFQFQADLLFVFRAMGILSGMVARLDPDLDPVGRIMPYVKRLILEEYTPTQESLLRRAVGLARLPRRLDYVLTRLEWGQLGVAAEFGPKAARRIERLERSVSRLTWLAAGGGLVLAGLWARQQARDRRAGRSGTR